MKRTHDVKAKEGEKRDGGTADMKSERVTNRSGGMRSSKTKGAAGRRRLAPAKVNKRGLSKRGRGRPAINPEERDRHYVLTMVAHGATQDEICAVLKIGQTALRKHYAAELAHGASMFDNDLRWALRMRAVGGPTRDWTRVDTTALIFCCKTRLKMVEPGKERDIGDLRVEDLTDRQLDLLLERIVARRAGSDGEGPSRH